MNFLLVVFAGLIGVSTPFFFHKKSPEWNDLKVHWGLNPFSSDNFESQPRTSYIAWSKEFVKVSECNESSPFRGARYIKGNDNSMVLLYDIKGKIAGIQTVVPKGLPKNYPAKGLVPPFVEMDDGYYMTAYFVPPETICTKGRSGDEFAKEGTGTELLIQTGRNPEKDIMRVPLKEKDLASTKWVKGKCFWSMGQHYWYDISYNMDCAKFFPVFIMYNKGRLNGFGWSLGADLKSPYFEHPPKLSFGSFFKNPPKCLYDQGSLSTMHIFLTKYARWTNHC